METITDIAVREEEIDQLGHVNNKVYVSYFESGRGQWFSKAGLSFDDMSEKKIGTVVVRLDINFKKEARLGEHLRVKTTPIKMGNRSFEFKQVILNESDEVITEAKVITVMFDLATRKSTVVADEIKQHIPSGSEN
ncbi:acyl-CoA thioesterase [Desertibacillus haloalkaliphilus]|uniref:acyl-CoA thioesterase n=1 Tax=Desertibacillus haloalkaliphilus TaxID=1328930 RepID=UPI001C27F9B4|nr:acyl-CoA thioesterase [Desertibacillus haloalkaliphilus]MBU8907657.1 acyl-CoA thioesterase [Desertibacillus haloalkaliphilus]